MRQIIALLFVILAIIASPGLVFADSDFFGQPGPGVSCTPVPGETVTVSDDLGNSYTVAKCSFPGGDPNRVVELQAP